MKVHDVMESDVKTCRLDDNWELVATLMWNNDCGSITVIDRSGAPISTLTDRDIAMSCSLNHKPLWEPRARDVTNNRPPYTCQENDDMSFALETMRTYRIRRLPVMDKTGHLRGLISSDDIVAASEGRLPGMSFRDTMSTLKAVRLHHWPW